MCSRFDKKSVIVVLVLLPILGLALRELNIGVGRRDQDAVLNILKTLDYEALTVENKCDVVLAYSELSVWGSGDKRSWENKALQLSKDLLKNYPDNWKVNYTCAIVLAHIVQRNPIVGILHDSSIRYHLEKAMDLAPGEYLPYLVMGVRYLEVPWPFKDLDKAERYLLQALKLKPEHLYTYLELGKLYEQRKEWCSAVKMYKKTLELPVEEEWEYISFEAKDKAAKRLKEIEWRCTEKGEDANSSEK
ncbi:MAG: hypothetical protein DRP27_02280 [Thermotogae bacterium]|nr:MAG: hypothetical protein DRP27_02280 [Thermotogota bacterium]RLG28840.1 MAG: hypothetical protein DRN97_12770 [Methanosarcinales archaeon]